MDSPARDTRDTASLRVLVVVEDPEFARSLSETLAANGYIVETATDAEEALETAKRFDAGVALIDVRLGGSSGLDLVPNLRRGRPGLICAMMAELAAFETAVDALRAGADDYLTKPVDMTWLFATLERCFARRLLRNEEEAAEAALREAHDSLEAKVEERTRAMRESERRYRQLFDASPISIWVEDWSAVKAMIDRLAGQRVTDWTRHLADHPEQVREAVDRVRIIDINPATLDIYRAERKQQVVDGFSGEEFTDDEVAAFGRELIAFAEGHTTFATEANEKAYDGADITTRIRAAIPDDCRDTWSRVFTMIEDVSERWRAEHALHESEERYHALFEGTPISTREEDFSKVKARIDALNIANDKDFAAYLDRCPEFVAECAELIVDIDANKASVELHHVDDKTNFLATFTSNFSDQAQRTLSRHSPYTIQIRGNRTTFPPPRELYPLCSHPMA